VLFIILGMLILNVHIIRMDGKISMILKQSMGISLFYIDTRNLGMMDYLSLPSNVQVFILKEKKEALVQFMKK